MQISIEALIIALRGAADALEKYDLHAGDGLGVEPAQVTPAVQAAPAQELPPQTDAAPWETEQPTPPAAATQPQVTPDDIKGLYQQMAQQGVKVDMLGMLSSLKVQKVGELDGEGRAQLYEMMKMCAF
ncbi:hypothetical protein TPMD04_56 [Thiohalocapsa phage LS06-2018-MD04]|nr:hypothetical protein TPMD04_56 [Thiohalocapsa phage LS06-2018-MD04]